MPISLPAHPVKPESGIFVAALLASGLKFAVVGASVASVGYPYARAPLACTAALVAVFTVALSYAPAGVRRWCGLGLDAVVSLIVAGDLWHRRFYGDLMSVGEAQGLGHVHAILASLPHVVRAADLLLFADVIVLTWIAARHQGAMPEFARGWPRRVVGGIAAAVAVASTSVALTVLHGDPDEVLKYQVQRSEVAAAVGLAGYHIYDIGKYFVYPALGRLVTTNADVVAVDHEFERITAGRVTSRLAGIAAGSNVILINAESLEGFAVDMTVNGQPVMPNLMKFTRDCLQFTDFYEQTDTSSTSDAEFSVLNSLLPAASGAVATRYDANEFRALPQVLAERGYRTLSASGEAPSFWNMRAIHEKYGVSRSWFLPDLEPGEWVGVGLDDTSFLTQMATVMREQSQPFFMFLLTSSNHHPYTLPDHLKKALPNPLPGTMAGDYLQSARHFDDAFGALIESLSRSGLLDRSVIALYGDHRAWLDEPDLARLWLLAGHAGKASQLDLWKMRRRVPFMIRLPNGAMAGPWDVVGGDVDVTPTLLSLLGVDAKGPWLGHDLTAPSHRLVAFRDGAVTDGGTFVVPNETSAPGCFTSAGTPLPCDLLRPQREEARQIVATSDRVIEGNLAKRVTQWLTEHASPAQSQQPFQIIAHRGDPTVAPENTLSSIRSALDLGVDIVEVDVRLTRDNVPVLFHDETVDRTTNGHGSLSTLTLRQAKALDAGGWMNPRFVGERIPTLEEALGAVRGRGRLYLDIKVDDLAVPIRDAFQRAGVGEDQAVVAAWTSMQRDEFLEAMPHAKVIQIEEMPTLWGETFFWQERTRRLWGTEYTGFLSFSFVGDAVIHGLPVWTFTIDDEPSMRRLIEMGVAGIETDDARLLLRVAKSLHVR